jgi:hypothetical protein
MSSPITRRTALLSIAAAGLSGCGGGGGGGGAPDGPQLPVGPIAGPDGPSWPGFGRDPQHTALSAIATQDLNRISWSTPVDDAPQYTASGTLLIHYGSPVISPRNTVVHAVRTASNGYRIEARSGQNGSLWWSANTDYAMPPHNWVPSYNMVLSAAGRLYAPGAGGKVLMRETVEGQTPPAFQPLVFFGAATYNANPAAYDATVFINTPLVADAQGNVFFGFQVTGANPAGLVGGIARIGANGQGTWVSAATAAADVAMTKAAMNSAPALSLDGSTLYVAVNAPAVPGTVQRGYLLALDSTTLAVRARVSLLDPGTNTPARVSDNGTSSPAVGPDGRVFFGVLEAVSGEHNFRGWLLQYDAMLNPAGVPGGFGWDVTPTIIPATMVPSYSGPSTYLLALKYNNYAPRGDGLNRMAVIDPRASQADTIIPAVSIMREVMTVLSPTPDPDNPGGREEWCINTMAADPVRRSVLANNEDGVMYRWDLTTNTFTQSLRLNNGLGQAYTPTLVGTDGAVYAISNATLFAIRA